MYEQEMEKKKITVFTPTYNRAHTLIRCYESLLLQTCFDFCWLVVDDGSKDGTRELVETWQSQTSLFPIRYVYQENGGMHTAHNLAYRLIDTELNLCLDSDDYLAGDAIEQILKLWQEKGGEETAGIIGLDGDFQGSVIGKAFLPGMERTTLGGYYAKGGAGDKKLIYRTDLMKKYPEYPVFEGEKYVSLGYKYQLCDREYELLILNQILCFVEYQADGSSSTMFSQYRNNPKGFAFIRKMDMQYPQTLWRRYQTCIHYVSSSLLAGNRYFLRESPRKIGTLLAIPFGMGWTGYLLWDKRRKGDVG